MFGIPHILKKKITSFITLSTGQISKIRLIVFPKYVLATQRQRFELDTTLQNKNQPFPNIIEVPKEIATNHCGGALTQLNLSQTNITS